MRDAALPLALVAAALGLALASAPKRLVAPSIVLFALLAGGAALLPLGEGWSDTAFYACWGAVILAGLAALSPRPLPHAPLFLAAIAGLSAGAVASVTASPGDLWLGLPWVLICLPAGWIIDRKGGIAVKVVASWLIAVCALAAALPLTTPTPGYAADHME